jgi:hypothetical protein
MAAHLIILDLVARLTFDEEDRSGGSSLCTLPHLLVSLSLLGPNILLSSLSSNSYRLYSSFSVRDKVYTYLKLTKL